MGDVGGNESRFDDYQTLDMEYIHAVVTLNRDMPGHRDQVHISHDESPQLSQPMVTHKNKPTRIKSSSATQRRSLAKLSPPKLSSVCRRSRLFNVLKRASAAPIIWISAPAGSGKTTLVASYLEFKKLPFLWYQVDAGDSDLASFFYYLAMAAKRSIPKRKQKLPILTPEYLAGLPTFTRNFFRDLFGAMKRPSVLVLDNYQDATDEALLHKLLPQALEEIPAGINVVVLSRSDPPPNYARLQASGRISVLRGGALSFTETESLQLAKQRLGRKSPSRATLNTLQENTLGWAAGLVLMLEQADRIQSQCRHDKMMNTQQVFDYFASEIFDHTNPATQEFLLKTAFLPMISAALAEPLTGTTNAAAILDDLVRRNYFTIRRDDAVNSFDYHPLFKTFLLQRASVEYTTDRIRQIKQRCAHLTADAGHVESAVSLLLEAEDWAAAGALITTQASIVMEQGRTQTLQHWIKRLPKEVRDNNGWILYWSGVCLQMFDPAEARNYFAKAFSLFEFQEDATPLCLAWSGFADCNVAQRSDPTQMIQWLDKFPQLQMLRKPPPPDIEAATLVSHAAALWRSRPKDPRLSQHVERAAAMLPSIKNLNRKTQTIALIAYYYLISGELIKVNALLRTLVPDAADIERLPGLHIFCRVIQSYHQYLVGSPEQAIQFGQEALALGVKHGIRIFDQAASLYLGLAYLYVGDTAAARRAVDSVAPFASAGTLGIDYFFCQLSVSVLLHEGKHGVAVQFATSAIEASVRDEHLISYSASLIFSACARAKNGDLAGALADIARVRSMGKQKENSLIAYITGFSEAIILMLNGENRRATEVLRIVIQIGKHTGVMTHPSFCLRDDVAKLYALALDAGLDENYIRDAITKEGLLAPPDRFPDRWPWRYRVYTLGRFQIVKDDKPIRFEGKTQRRPLDLLKAIIAFGGRNVSEDKLAAALWPEAEGDAAHESFKIALHRLRKLLGSEEIVKLENRELTLNSRYMWVDVWAFERWAGEFDNGDNLAAVEPAIHVQRHYAGAFLAGEELEWALAPRERFRNKFLRAVTRLAERYESKGLIQDAIVCYEKAIDIEPLNEDFYLQLMSCYRRIDRPLKALAAYKRCERTLQSAIQVRPTRKLQALYEEVARSSNRAD